MGNRQQGRTSHSARHTMGKQSHFSSYTTPIETKKLKMDSIGKIHIYLPKNFEYKELYEQLMFYLFNKHQRKIKTVKNSNVALIVKREKDFETQDRLISFYKKNNHLNMACLWKGKSYLNFTVKSIYKGDIESLLDKNIILSYSGFKDLKKDTGDMYVDFFKHFFQSAHKLRDIDNFGIVKYEDKLNVLKFRVYRNIIEPECVNDSMDQIKFKDFLLFGIDLEII
eukprot:GAHX01000909.1.p1 GENE.GAHX01000909.1~~GAHX01000909.1.p1  ORF type:complete len:225 (-),score=36.36 GAHX01000909.1:39-713(-)